MYGQSNSRDGIAVRGVNTHTTYGGYGGYFEANGATGIGVYGRANSDSPYGRMYGVYGYARTGGYIDQWAVYSAGDFGASGGKYFCIDHPFDPENKYLNHYCAEGPEPLLIYRGNAVLDAQGQALVELPHYFEAINRDFHYQLTCVGAFAPVYVAQEISNNRFVIAGGQPGLKVSWTVTGIRNDPWMRQRARPVEQDKPESERGKYQHPELYGQPAEMGMDYEADGERPSPVVVPEATPGSEDPSSTDGSSMR